MVAPFPDVDPDFKIPASTWTKVESAQMALWTSRPTVSQYKVLFHFVNLFDNYLRHLATCAQVLNSQELRDRHEILTNIYYDRYSYPLNSH